VSRIATDLWDLGVVGGVDFERPGIWGADRYTVEIHRRLICEMTRPFLHPLPCSDNLLQSLLRDPRPVAVSLVRNHKQRHNFLLG